MLIPAVMFGVCLDLDHLFGQLFDNIAEKLHLLFGSTSHTLSYVRLVGFHLVAFSEQIPILWNDIDTWFWHILMGLCIYVWKASIDLLKTLILLQFAKSKLFLLGYITGYIIYFDFGYFLPAFVWGFIRLGSFLDGVHVVFYQVGLEKTILLDNWKFVTVV